MEFAFPPGATREGTQIRKRLIIEAQKSYEKYKLAQEQAEAEKQDTHSEGTVQSERPVFEATALYFSDVRQEEVDDGEDTDSGTSRLNLFFQNIFLDRFCRRLISTHRGYTLRWYKFLSFTFILQAPLYYLVQHVEHVKKWGALLVLIVFFVVGFVVCVPIYMYYMMLGYFTRRSYLRYWDSVPLLKGLGFAFAGVTLYQQMHNTILSAVALEYIIYMFSAKLPWEGCHFAQASNGCVPAMETYPRYEFLCCPYPHCTEKEQLAHVFKYAAYDFYQNEVLKLGYDNVPADTSYNWKLAIKLTVVWIMVYITITAGIRRFATIMAIINIIMYCLLLPVVLSTFFIGPNYSMIWVLSNDIKSLLNYLFWFHTGISVIHREIPADVMAFSSISKVGVSITVDTVISYIMRLLFTAIFTVWISIGVTYQQVRYNVESSACIRSTGDVLFFALFPDIITELPVPQIWLVIYFALIFLWGLSTVIYVYNAFLDAFFEEFRSVAKWRVVVAALLCGGAGCGAGALLEPNVMENLKDTVTNILPQVTIFLLCLSLFGLYIYSMTRFRNDYHFFTGEILHNYWAVGLKVAMLIILLASVLIWIQVCQGKVERPLALYLALVAFLCGILISALRYALKVTKTWISPSTKWGPPGRRQKLARIKFDPSHDLHYRAFSQKCQHECLLYSVALKKEIKYWINKKHFLENELHEHMDQKPVTISFKGE